MSILDQNMHNNFAQTIVSVNQGRGKKLALVDNCSQLTYSQLEEHILSFGGLLAKSGIRPQDRVIISLEDCVEWPVAFLAVIATGGNPVLVSTDLPDSTINQIVSISDARYCIGKPIDGLVHFSKTDILDTQTRLESFYQYHPDEICFWLLSSGTTGEPKCVVHRHQDLERLLELIAWPAYLIDEDSRVLSTAKLSFTYGFNNSLTFGLGKGATVYLINGVPAPSKIFDLVKRHQITHFFTVPTVINSMIKHTNDHILSQSVKIMVSSGEPLPRTIGEQFQAKHSVKILDGLGMSECMYNYCTTTMDNNEFGTIGKPLPGIECEVRNDDGSIAKIGEIGEMWVKHPCTALLYWKDWSKTKQTFVGEWIRTGDKVIKQLNGNYLYVSRRDDLIKINGQYVSPIEIESTMLAFDWIVECGVVSKTDHQGLAEIHAFVATTKPSTSGEIRQALSNILPNHKIPKHIHFIDTLPKTVTYKKTRSKLRSMLESVN